MNPNPSHRNAARVMLAGIGLIVFFTTVRAAEGDAPVPSVATNSPAAANQPAEATGTAPVAGAGGADASTTDYGSFRVIADRNIFNAGRSRRSGRSGERPRAVQVDSFTVVGTMSYAKGDVVFFDGSSGIYRKAMKLGESIAGHKIVGISAEEVQLEAGDKKLSLKVGGQMRRVDEGPWEMGTAGVSHSVTATGADPGAGAATGGDEGSGGEVSDVLKRLLQKRAQEEKNENQ